MMLWKDSGLPEEPKASLSPVSRGAYTPLTALIYILKITMS